MMSKTLQVSSKISHLHYKVNRDGDKWKLENMVSSDNVINLGLCWVSEFLHYAKLLNKKFSDVMLRNWIKYHPPTHPYFIVMESQEKHGDPTTHKAWRYYWKAPKIGWNVLSCSEMPEYDNVSKKFVSTKVRSHSRKGLSTRLEYLK